MNETNDFIDLTNFKMVKISKSMYALNGPVEIKQSETEDMMVTTSSILYFILNT